MRLRRSHVAPATGTAAWTDRPHRVADSAQRVPLRGTNPLHMLQATNATILTLLVLASSAMAQQPEKYRLLATNRTGTMQDELNQAGARCYSFAGTQAADTAFRDPAAVVIMTLDPDDRRFRYILLATNPTGTMQREMNEAPPEYNFAGMTVFSSTFGARQAAAIIEAPVTDDQLISFLRFPEDDEMSAAAY